MAITYTENYVFNAHGASSGSLTSGSVTVSAGDLILCLYAEEDNTNSGTLTISNTGGTLSWTNHAVTNTTGNCKVGAWSAVASTGGTYTVTVTHAGDDLHGRILATIVHTGVHATTPVPAGNVFSGVGGTDVSQSITPTSSGSALWMVAADFSGGNTFVAAANCTLAYTRFQDGTAYTATIIRPTTQPRTDAAAFAIGETDTSGTIAWIALEVQAAASAAPISCAWLTA